MNVHSAWADTLRHDFSCTSEYRMANDRNMEHGSSTDDCTYCACRYRDSYVLKRTLSAMICPVNPVLALENICFRVCFPYLQLERISVLIIAYSGHVISGYIRDDVSHKPINS